MPKKIILTRELLEENLTGGKGFKRKQALALGESYPLKSGWKDRIIDKEFSEEQISRFILAGKNKKSLKKTPHKKKSKDIQKQNNNESFKEAVSLACWLIREQNKSLKSAIQIASNKHGLSNKEELQESILTKLPKGELTKAIGNKAILKDAVDDAIWLVNNTKLTLNNVINKVSEKYNYKPKSHIEHGIRENFPEDFFKSRAKIPKGTIIGTSTQSRAVENWQQNKHLKSIMDE